MFSMLMKSISMPGRKEALPGRDEPVLEPMPHALSLIHI